MNLSHPTSRDLPGIIAWAKRLVDDINRFSPPIQSLPTFADDAAAAAGRLKVGEPYVSTDGIVRRRVV